MSAPAWATSRIPALERLRAATRDAHDRLDRRVDAVARLADPMTRDELVARYAALFVPAEGALGPYLRGVDGLDFDERSRATLQGLSVDGGWPAFPEPASRSEALGMFYVLEGSTLGGRMILRELARRGIEDPELGFLDPYGAQTGRRWRGFLDILERETSDDAGRVSDAEAGAVRGFAHAEAVLCGSAA